MSTSMQEPQLQPQSESQPELKALSGRDAYRQELTELASLDRRILCLEADLGDKNHPFAAAHPDRFFNLGIAEGAMVDMAVGLAEAGFKPFISTFAPFAALRAAESLKLALGYIHSSITIVAPYAGVSGAWFGTTHHCLEDLAVLRSFPGVNVAAPHGEAEMRAVVRSAAISGEPHYIRTGRNAVYDSIAHNHPQIPPVAWAHRGSSDICLVSVGEEATRMCQETTGLADDIAHAHLIYVDQKHLDEAAKELAQDFNTFIVVEEHRRAGGVGEALALTLPGSQVFSVSADERWPINGGDHRETMDQIGLNTEAILRTITEITAHVNSTTNNTNNHDTTVAGHAATA